MVFRPPFVVWHHTDLYVDAQSLGQHRLLGWHTGNIQQHPPLPSLMCLSPYSHPPFPLSHALLTPHMCTLPMQISRCGWHVRIVHASCQRPGWMKSKWDQCWQMVWGSTRRYSNCTWYLYIACHYNKLHFNILPPKYIFCGIRHRNYARFLWLHKKAPLRKGFSIQFSVQPLPKLNWTLLNLSWGFSSGFREIAELNQYYGLEFGQNSLWTELNRTLPSLWRSAHR